MTDPAPLAAELPPALSAPPPPALVDAFPDSEPFRLNGWLERSGFAPVWTALLVFVIAFVVFNIAGAVAIGVALVQDAAGSGAVPTMADMEALLASRPHLVLGSNAAGQLVGFALFALLAARLSSHDWRAFLRLRLPDAKGLGLAAVGWVALYPIVLWAGEINRLVPLPEWLAELEKSQTDMLEGLLMGGELSTLFLFFAVAVTPAVCEELIFRGYLQRQVERRAGSVKAFVIVGVAFGLYHLRLSQALPLSLLGVYLGFVVWATGSVWTGTVVHLLNNGFAVLATGYVRGQPDLDMETIDNASVPILAVLVAAVALVAVVRGILDHRRAVTGGATTRSRSCRRTHPFRLPSPPDHVRLQADQHRGLGERLRNLHRLRGRPRARPPGRRGRLGRRVHAARPLVQPQRGRPRHGPRDGAAGAPSAGARDRRARAHLGRRAGGRRHVRRRDGARTPTRRATRRSWTRASRRSASTCRTTRTWTATTTRRARPQSGARGR